MFYGATLCLEVLLNPFAERKVKSADERPAQGPLCCRLYSEILACGSSNALEPLLLPH